MKKGQPAAELAERFPSLHELVYDKWRVDEFYEETIIGAVDSLAEAAVAVDKYVVDGIIARLTAFVVAATGTGLRLVQTGRVQAYAAVMVVGVGGLGWFFTTSHASVQVEGDATTGNYKLTAAPGLGYQYRWDSDGDGKPDATEFGSTSEVNVTLDRGKSQNVVVEVRNAFGRISKRTIKLERPKIDASRAAGTGPSVIQVQQGADGKLRGVLPGQRPLEVPAPPGGMPMPNLRPRVPTPAPGGGAQ